MMWHWKWHWCEICDRSMLPLIGRVTDFMTE